MAEEKPKKHYGPRMKPKPNWQIIEEMQLLTQKDVALILRRSEPWIKFMRLQHKGPPMWKLGATWVIQKEELAKWIEDAKWGRVDVLLQPESWTIEGRKKLAAEREAAKAAKA